jgi:hypothetical protein
MFKKIVPVTLKLKDSSDYTVAKRICEFLANKFEIKMQVIRGCFKFVESDIFLYVDNLKMIYLVFVDQLAFIKEVSNEASSDSVNQSGSTDPRKSMLHSVT